MSFFEKRFLGRGVKFYFIVNSSIPMVQWHLWKIDMNTESPLADYYQRIDVSDYVSGGFGKWKNWKQVKVVALHASFKIKSSRAEKYYYAMFKNFTSWFINYCKIKGIECRVYDFQMLYKLEPEEKSGEFCPVPSLRKIANEIIRPPVSLPTPPNTGEEIVSLALKQTALNKRALDAMINAVKLKYGSAYIGLPMLQVKDANTGELELFVAEPGMEVYFPAKKRSVQLP